MTAERGSSESTSARTEGQELVLERVFEAPRALVWRSYTEPDRVARWWGPRGTTTTVVEMEVRPGGRWRYINRGSDGQEAPFTGEYLEVVPPERIVNTFIFDVPPFNESQAVETVVFEDLDGRTKVTARTRFSSVEDLEGAVSTGMIPGAIESWDRLAEELAQG